MDNSLVNEGKMEVATFNCFKGYRLNGPSTIYCEERYWSEEFVPECKRELYTNTSDESLHDLLLQQLLTVVHQRLH